MKRIFDVDVKGDDKLMRLIDADKFERELENSCRTESETHAFVNFLAYLDEQPTIGINNCVPVSDKLPDEYSELFITTDDGLSLHVFYSNGEYKFGNFRGVPITGNVIAWMPFYTPEPYEI